MTKAQGDFLCGHLDQSFSNCELKQSKNKLKASAESFGGHDSFPKNKKINPRYFALKILNIKPSR